VRRALGAGVVVSALVSVTAGCGGVMLGDDLAVQRSGVGSGAALDLVVNDSGTASCNRRAPVPVSDPQLIQARELSAALAEDARRGASLPAGAQPVFRYYVRTPDGHLSFSDDSPGAPSTYGRLQLLVLQIAQRDCHLAR